MLDGTCAWELRRTDPAPPTISVELPDVARVFALIDEALASMCKVAAYVNSESLRRVARDLPDVEGDRAAQFVDAAIAHATPRVPAELLVALAWGESRFDPEAKPACGVMQVYPHDLDAPPTACAAWRRDLHAGVQAGVTEIEIMLDDHRVHGSMQLALLYRACGNRAFDGTCASAKYAWVRGALERWRAIATRSFRAAPRS